MLAMEAWIPDLFPIITQTGEYQDGQAETRASRPKSVSTPLGFSVPELEQRLIGSEEVTVTTERKYYGASEETWGESMLRASELTNSFL